MMKISPATSKNLQTANELTVIAPIKQGLVQISDPMSYKTRLERLLDVLFQQRKLSVEVGGSGFVGPLEKLRSLHFVHWSVIDEGTRLLLTVAYDKPWEPYIRSIVDEAGPILDVIFFHCEGYEHSTTRHGYPAFARWVRRYQQTTNFYYADFPELTVDDIRYQRKLRGLHDSLTLDALPLDARVDEPTPRDDPDQLLATVLNLYRLKSYYPKRDDATGEQLAYTDRAIFNRAVKQIAEGYTPQKLEKLASQAMGALNVAYNDFEAWYKEAVAEPKRFTMPEVSAPDPEQVQGNILSSYEHMTHGCAVLASWTPSRVKDSLGYLQREVTTESQAADAGVEVKLNVALTYNGLKALGLGTAELLSLPVEFREGMEARAGLLGDVADHHPLNWVRPTRNFPPERASKQRVALSTVDVVITLETREESRATRIASILTAIRALDPNTISRENRPEAAAQAIQAALAELESSLTPAGSAVEQGGHQELYSALNDVRELLIAAGPHQKCHWAQRVQRLMDAADRLEGGSAEEPLLPRLRKALQNLQEHGLNILHVQPLRRYEKRRSGAHYREHFGFLDGISQVQPVAAPDLGYEQHTSEVSYGEALLGYINDHGDAPSEAASSPLLKNGSFLVMRKLAQAVEDFEGYVKKAAAWAQAPEGEIRGCLMGRTPEGVPLAAAAKPGALDDFSYQGDEGVGTCPFQAHVRLANPRTPTKTSVHGRPMRVPRLLRRGFSYGPPLSEATRGAERGLLFMSYGASIAEQYEVVQRWLNGGNSTGLPSAQNDPITGPGDPHRAPFRYRSKDGRVVKLPAITRPFVKLEWGLYLFAPAKSGLAALAERAKPAQPLPPEAEHIGKALLDRLLLRDQQLQQQAAQASSPEESRQLLDQATLMWKMALEGQGQSEREAAATIWLAIRQRGGVQRTTYGVLVGIEDAALRVLKDETCYSVRDYWLRMKAANMPMHLGMDAKPAQRAVCPVSHGQSEPRDAKYVAAIREGAVNYALHSLANKHLNRLERADAFRLAHRYTRAALAQCEHRDGRAMADLFVVGEKVIAKLSRHWFGLPDGAHMKEGGLPIDVADGPHCPADFTTVAQDFFRPHPDEWTSTLSRERGAKIRQAARQVVQAALDSSEPHRFIQLLSREPSVAEIPGPRRVDLLTDAVVGAVDGFVAANWGSFAATLSQWIRRQELWRVQLRCEPDLRQLSESLDGLTEEQLDKAESLWSVVYAALMAAPIPAWLHRTAIAETTLGAVPIQPGDRIVLNLGSIAIDKSNPQLLFGGRYSDDKGAGSTQTPQHACPAQPAALGVLLGMLSAVLLCNNIRADGPLAITFDALEAPAEATHG
jgi:Dyp-type peroxidase family